jgi:isopentenyl-diphosphate delta-isomerase
VKEELILVNENDQVIGVGEKLQTHLVGALHRAFSIYIVNSAGQLLLQKRSSTKYHSQGLWSNTCCGHPRPGESIEEASRRRLGEEMGLDCEVREVFEFIYRAKLDNGLYEYEYDHVVVGRFDGSPTPNRDEVDEWKWVDLVTLKLDIEKHPENYTYWFRISLDELCRSIKSVDVDSEISIKDPSVECMTMRSS